MPVLILKLFPTTQSHEFIQKRIPDFKGVVKPDMFDLSEETVRDIENYMEGAK